MARTTKPAQVITEATDPAAGGRRWPTVPVPARLSTVLPWVALAARLALAYTFAIWAGLPKLTDTEGTVRSVRGFRLMPEAAVRPFAYGLPMVEILLGVLLLVGLLTRISAAITAALLLMFMFGIGMAWARGLQIDCGCAGTPGTALQDAVAGYRNDLLRDLGFLLLAALLVLWPRSPLSLDRLLKLDPPTPELT